MEDDDFGVESTQIRTLPRTDIPGNYLVGVRSYLRIKREREETGEVTPEWETLPVVFDFGEWCSVDI